MDDDRVAPDRRPSEPQTPAIYPGNIVALTLAEGAAPLRCYVGEVQAVDEKGVRITLMDWIAGSFVGMDMFAPWNRITAALVATEDHSLDKSGMTAFTKWQTSMNTQTAPKPGAS